MKGYVFAAVFWALLILAFFFGLIAWHEPFASWSGGDQAQLFQAMVALAGFGGGLIALFFAGQQVAGLVADPLLEIQRDGKSLDTPCIREKDFWVQDQQALTGCNLEIENTSDVICDLWQVVASAPKGVTLENASGWNRLHDGRISRQAGPEEALYPHVPFPLGGLRIGIPAAAFARDEAGTRCWSGDITLQVATQRRVRKQVMKMVLNAGLVPKWDAYSGANP